MFTLNVMLDSIKPGPPTNGGQGVMPRPTFSENYWLKIRFSVILPGIQNFFWPGTPRISSGALQTILQGQLELQQ